jgi:hypothetical protein
VRAAADDIVRGVYIQRISEKTGVPRDTLEREIGEAPTRDARPSGAPDRRRRDEGRRTQDFTPPAVSAPKKDMRTNAERTLLLLMVHDERWVEEAVKHVEADLMSHPLYRILYQGLLDTEGQRDAAGEWLARFPAEVLPLLEEMRGDPEVASMVPAEAFFRGSVSQILERAHLERLAELNRQLNIAAPEQQLLLIREKAQLVKTMREHGYLRKPGFVQALTQTAPAYRADPPTRRADPPRADPPPPADDVPPPEPPSGWDPDDAGWAWDS